MPRTGGWSLLVALAHYQPSSRHQEAFDEKPRDWCAHLDALAKTSMVGQANLTAQSHSWFLAIPGWLEFSRVHGLANKSFVG